MLVSIITVVWNGVDTISDAIDSVLGQNYPDIEYIIVDGGSTDGTIGIIESYGGKISQFTSEADDGLYQAMNKGIRLASGDVIGILNADDLYAHEAVISNIVKEFKSKQYLDLVLASIVMVKQTDISIPVRKYLSTNFQPWRLRFGFAPPHPASFIKKAAYCKYGLYDENYKNAADFEMFVRLLLVNKLRFITSEDIVVCMRLGGASTSGIAANVESTREIIDSLKINSIYSNYIFVCIRIVPKLFQKYLNLKL